MGGGERGGNTREEPAALKAIVRYSYLYREH